MSPPLTVRTTITASSIGADLDRILKEEDVAATTPPDIDGLMVFPGILDSDVTHPILAAIADSDLFRGGTRDQVMLFERGPGSDGMNTANDGSEDSAIPSASIASSSSSSIPPYLRDLLLHLSTLLQPHLDSGTYDTLFTQPLARQIILNLYRPGQGITPHIDLPNRYADGILGVSLLGSCVMDFVSPIGEVESVYVPAGTVYSMCGEARWEWSHGIEGRMEDWVMDGDGNKGRARRVMRGTRVSVTFRWMKEGGDVLS